MPLLDVSDALDDADFADQLTLTVRVVAVGDDGRGVTTETTTNISGVVTSDRGRNRDLIAEGQRQVGSIMVHTRSRLTPGSEGREADLVAWNGRQYTVSSVDDYSRYGAGFICANCDLFPLSGGPDGE